ncbi:phosphotransferase [Agrobacterium sp. NPDC089420]|uniref:phosphotransferase n=1 Tax=Agrobacterium sp. NPDC089420 TaxID=3363918 RepID=UPI00384E0B7B
MHKEDLLERFDGGGDSTFSQVGEHEVSRILEQHWQVRGNVRSLVSERDEILEVVADDDRHFVLKIYSASESPSLADLRAQACVHIAEKDPALPVPKIVRTAGGLQAVARMESGEDRVVQLMTFLDGVSQVTTLKSSQQAFEIGNALARTASALADFKHPADRRNLVWDLANAANVRPLLPEVYAGRWHMPHQILQRFEDHILETLHDLPMQVIHNDFNGHNLLMHSEDVTRITGIIDFGDVTRSQRINDVATAACYQLRLDEPGLSGALDVVRGYNAVTALDSREIAILPDLILTRLAIAVAITEFRAVRLPERASQILKNTGYAWRALSHLTDLDKNWAVDRFFAVCDKETSS